MKKVTAGKVLQFSFLLHQQIPTRLTGGLLSQSGQKRQGRKRPIKIGSSRERQYRVDRD